MADSTPGTNSYSGGTSGDDDVKSNYGDKDGTTMDGGGGNDTMRGGNYDDIITGGGGNDMMFGGAGAAEFRFLGTQISGGSDADKIFDLNFGTGDTLRFQGFAEGTFVGAGAGTSGNGSRWTADSWADVVAIVAGSDKVAASKGAGDNLVLRVVDADGDIQDIIISNAWTAFTGAGGAADVII